MLDSPPPSSRCVIESRDIGYVVDESNGDRFIYPILRKFIFTFHQYHPLLVSCDMDGGEIH
jgi:hypothetical protein